MLNIKLNNGDAVLDVESGEYGVVVGFDEGVYDVEFADGTEPIPASGLSLDGLYPYYVTYGLGGNLAQNYSVVWARTYLDARDQIDEITKGKFAFCYDKARFNDQATRYRLTEVPLQAQLLGPDDCQF